MVIRVDTTNITRGLDFNIIVKTDIEPSVSIYAFNSASHSVEMLEFTLSKSGIFYKALSKAPYFDGYILAKINNRSIIVKKIGHPLNLFVIGYKAGYTIPYNLYNEDGNLLKSDFLTHIIDGFYFCEVGLDITIIETLKKRFIIKNNMTKLNYDVTIGNTTLQDITLQDITLNATLGNASLFDAPLQDITLQEAELPNIKIEEY